MKSKDKIIILEILLLAIILFSKYIIDIDYNYFNAYIASTFAVFTLITYKILGLPRANKRVKKVVTQYSVIIILSYIILSFIVGLLVGFTLNPLNLGIIDLVKTIYGIVILIICEEFIRYMIAKKCINNNNKTPLILITGWFIIMDIILALHGSKDLSTYSLFVQFTTVILPSIARNIVLSYLCYHVSLIPGLIFNLFFHIYTYIFPVFPDIGNYINSLIGVVLPYLLYMLTIKSIKDYEKTKMTISLKRKFWYLNIPFWSLTVILLILISGLFEYQIMAVGSKSMSPSIEYGDAVVFKHFENDTDYYKLKKGDVIVFLHDNKHIIHRISKFNTYDGKIVIQTKGDNNNAEDPYTVRKKDLVGVVKTNVKFIGYPTVWLSEIFNK